MFANIFKSEERMDTIIFKLQNAVSKTRAKFSHQVVYYILLGLVFHS
jgi:hypothetical protein